MHCSLFQKSHCSTLSVFPTPPTITVVWISSHCGPLLITCCVSLSFTFLFTCAHINSTNTYRTSTICRPMTEGRDTFLNKRNENTRLCFRMWDFTNVVCCALGSKYSENKAASGILWWWWWRCVTLINTVTILCLIKKRTLELSQSCRYYLEMP